jgi:4-amino-4-deoxy-L-arabinose transferase-like glycosyltransferase
LKIQAKASGSDELPGGRVRRLKGYPGLTSLLLASLFLFMNLTILMSGGVRLGGDSPRYLGGAENLLRGLPLQRREIFHSGYESLIAVCRLTGAGLTGVICIQILLAATASVALYDLGRRLHGHRAGLIAAGLFVSNPDITRWNAFILTDSLYISLVILSVWSIHTASRRKRYWYFTAAAALGMAASVRPNGLLLLAVAVPYLVGHFISRQRLRRVVVSGIVMAAMLGALAASRFFPVSSHEHLEVTLRNGITGIDPWRVPMPPDPVPIRGDWAAAFSYAAAHPFASLRLALTRVLIELIHIRPFYSFRHNMILLATLPFIYFLALPGIKLNRDRSLTHLLLLVILSHLFLVAVTFADWDGRFLLHILPLICLFSSCAAASLIDRYLNV